MLSRVAESLFWIGRYVERAENTARLLDVNYYATLEGAGLVNEQWGPLLAISGVDESFRERGLRVDGRSVPHWLAFDPGNPSSIVSCLTSARENARSLRDRIPSEMWEALNRAYHALCFDTAGILAGDRLHEYCASVREACNLFFGMAMAAFPRDQGWEFLRAGQKLERGDNVLRLLSVRYRRRGEGEIASALENHRWMAVLKTASAYEAYRKRYHTRLEPRGIAEFLLLEVGFPRSVRYCVATLHTCLRLLAEANPGADREVVRESAWLLARLDHARIHDILDRDSPSLEDLLADFGRLGFALHRTYFQGHLQAQT